MVFRDHHTGERNEFFNSTKLYVKPKVEQSALSNVVVTEEKLPRTEIKVQQMGNICVPNSDVGEVQEQVDEPEDVTETKAMDKILCGPVEEVKPPEGVTSVGQWCYKTLSSLPATFQLMVEGDTGRCVTASETLALAVGLATSFYELGLKKFDKVCILGGNAIDVSIAAIAAHLTGMVSCPVDSLLKSYEYQHILKIIDPQIIICDFNSIPEIQNAMEKINLKVPLYAVGANETENVARLESLLKEVPVNEFSPEPSDDPKNELCVICCSSGTTGLPKGVQLSQHSLVYQCGVTKDIWQVGTVVLITSYFYWISGVLSLLGCTTNGVKRVLLKTSDPLDAIKAIDKYKTTVTIMSPSLLNEVAFHPQLTEYNVSSLAFLMAGGSPLLKSTLDKCKEVMPLLFIVQGYGATEMGGPVSSTSPGMDQLSLGKLGLNMKIKVVDRDTGELLGANEEGELHCHGPSTMMGYAGNSAATREVLDEEGWYHTGDICKYLEDGTLYLTGRAKELMKVENHQIAPAEIEGVIAEVPGVSDVVVVGINLDENTLPMALVVKMEGAFVNENDIIQAVEANLSEFKQLRAGVYFVDVIPRTATGKVKRALAQKLGEDLYNGSHTV